MRSLTDEVHLSPVTMVTSGDHVTGDTSEDQDQVSGVGPALGTVMQSSAVTPANINLHQLP